MALEIATALIGLGGVALGSIIPAAITLVTNRSERSKFQREKLWDVQREAYTSIVGSLVKARRIAEHIAVGYKNDAHGFDASPESRRALGQYQLHMQSAQDAFTTNQLVLSPEFIDMFEQMLRSLRDIAENPSSIAPDQAAETDTRMAIYTGLLARAAYSEIVPTSTRRRLGKRGRFLGIERAFHHGV